MVAEIESVKKWKHAKTGELDKFEAREMGNTFHILRD